MNVVISKALAMIDAGSGDDDSANGSFEAILSAPTLDRDGDTLKQAGWKDLPARIHVDLDHEMSVAGTVGSAEPFFDDEGRMRIKGTYASTPRAQEVRTLVNEGHITTMSVAFMTDRSIKDGSPNRELLNGAFVAVPSNREAVVVSSKAFQAMQDELKAGARNSAGDGQMITAIHDAAVALGAACVEPAPSTADGSAEGANKTVRESFVIGKMLSGSLEDLRNRISDALDDAAGDGMWTWVRATFLDDGGTSGTVVYDLGEETFSRPFTIDGTAVTLGTTIECVTLVTSVATADPEVEADSTGVEVETLAVDAVDATPKESTEVLDREAFMAALDTVTKTSGADAGSPQESPAESSADAPAEPASKAAPQGPAVETAEAAVEAAVKAAEEVALDRSQLSHLKARILASNARLAS